MRNRCRDARRRAAARQDHRLLRPRQARDRDRVTGPPHRRAEPRPSAITSPLASEHQPVGIATEVPRRSGGLRCRLRQAQTVVDSGDGQRIGVDGEARWGRPARRLPRHLAHASELRGALPYLAGLRRLTGSLVVRVIAILVPELGRERGQAEAARRAGEVADGRHLPDVEPNPWLHHRSDRSTRRRRGLLRLLGPARSSHRFPPGDPAVAESGVGVVSAEQFPEPVGRTQLLLSHPDLAAPSSASSPRISREWPSQTSALLSAPSDGGLNA